VIFCWIPGHVGIKGNIAGDKLARDTSNVSHILPIPYSDIFPTLRSIIFSKWQAIWDSNPNNKLYKLFPKLQHFSPLHQSYTRLDYCNSLMYGIADGLMQRLQAVQNAAARLITGARRRDHISPALRQLHWLPVRQRVQFKLAVLVFKALHGLAVLDGRLSTRCRCRPPSTTVVWCRHMCSATDLYMPRRSCVRSRRTTSVERFADQPPSVWPLPWIFPTGSKNAFVRLCLQGLVTFVFRRWL